MSGENCNLSLDAVGRAKSKLCGHRCSYLQKPLSDSTKIEGRNLRAFLEAYLVVCVAEENAVYPEHHLRLYQN